MNTNKLRFFQHVTPTTTEAAELEYLIEQLSVIRREMLTLEIATFSTPSALHKTQIESAKNLLHYLALRRHDRRKIQESLAAHGLSSLGRAESHVIANIDAIEAILRRLSGNPHQPARPLSALTFTEGLKLLEVHTKELLGPKPAHRKVRVMVTMSVEAATDYAFVRKLMLNGMDCMRINCAYDDVEAWAKMIEHARAASLELGKDCRVLMDLAGPKIRTGPIKPSPGLLKWTPTRNQYGGLKRPVRIWLTSANNPVLSPTHADICLPLTCRSLRGLKAGDGLKFFDIRGSSRTMKVVEPGQGGWWAESRQTTYLQTGAVLHLVRNGKPLKVFPGRVGELPTNNQSIVLKEGETLILTKGNGPGGAAVYDEDDKLITAAHIPVTLPEIFDDVRAGDQIWFDDGAIGGTINKVKANKIVVKITNAQSHGSKLRADKGINLPNTTLRLPSLTEKDREDLKFIAANADMVGYSFLRTAADVEILRSELAKLGRQDLGIVLKIETQGAFEHLSNILLAAMRSPSVSVMIARGDLAIECGWERMAEVQEEILWICEAAHVPVIWATQVLESLAKRGVPSRAEITDAAMGERAECVMLNKGPYIFKAVSVLDDILRRMENHQNKKRSMLRRLKLADQLSCPETRSASP